MTHSSPSIDLGARSPRLTPFEVSATLPEPLLGLERLSRNLWWSWTPEARRLFQELSPLSWIASGSNPVAFLRRLWTEDLAQRSRDAAYLARLEALLARFDAYLAERPGGAAVEPLSAAHPVAYYCAEYGIHESLRMYSGGLGVLAGDHLKSASDVGVPLVAIGLFYRHGYLTQRLTASGEQISIDLVNDPRDLPCRLVLGPDGAPLEVRLPLDGREAVLHAWEFQVGRVPLYLLDTDVPANEPDVRGLTKNLYDAHSETRLRQEVVLGVGGARLLAALGVRPSIHHLNEGHAAFSVLERVRGLVQESGLDFAVAREVVRASTAFTTHTPVPAGHDRFGHELIERFFRGCATEMGLDWDRFLDLGHAREDDASFNMTYLALHFAALQNGVSRLHGVESKRLLRPVWRGWLESEVPVTTITNGVHLPTWAAQEIAALLGAKDRALSGEDFAAGAASIEPAALWGVLRAAKQRLLDRIRIETKRRFVERHDSPLLLDRMLDGLDESALWIGFARRFAPYKRALLLFQDPARLRALLDDRARPVRVVVAGKAHPNDERGKDIVRRIAELTRSDELAGRVFFVENYEVDLARALVQGVDVWLNTPTRMLEASGTSGMKAAANGALNLSIADGWWAEGHIGGEQANGWRIGDGREYSDQELQNQLDAAALYGLLEEEIVPRFFERDADGLPRGWLKKVLRSLQTIPPVFNTDRMVREYVDTTYRPLARRHAALTADDFAGARARASSHARLRDAFEGIEVLAVERGDLAGLRVGDALQARVELDLGVLAPPDVVVEIVLGHAAGQDDLTNPVRVELAPIESVGSRTRFEGQYVIRRSGSYAAGLRVRPRSDDEPGQSLPELVRWL